eukprot:COSAG01_NODE_58282_length_307_cov_0.586538_2_plen_44_part_01
MLVIRALCCLLFCFSFFSEAAKIDHQLRFGTKAALMIDSSGYLE